MKIRGNDGFVMIEVLVLIMIILLFLTSLFSSLGFRHKMALMRIQKEEARCAAEAALQLMEGEIANGNTEWLENGLEKTDTILEFESEDGEVRVKIPITVWLEQKEEEMWLYAEAEVGQKKERAYCVLELPKKNSLTTNSNAETATSSNAEYAERRAE